MKESTDKYSCPATPFGYWFQDTLHPMQIILRIIVRISMTILMTDLMKRSQMNHNFILGLFFLASKLHWCSSLLYEIGTVFVLKLAQHLYITWAHALVAHKVKNVPAMWEALGGEDPLEKRKAIHSSILAWRIPWTGESGRVQFMVLQRVKHNWVTNTFSLRHIYPYTLNHF